MCNAIVSHIAGGLLSGLTYARCVPFCVALLGLCYPNTAWAVAPTLGSEANLKTQSASATNITLANVDAGNAIVVIVFQTSGSLRTYSVADECLNSYPASPTKAENYGNGESVQAWVVAASVCADASLIITVTQAGGSVASYNIKAFEVVPSTANLSVDVSSSLTNTTATTHNSSADATVIDTAADVFLVAACEGGSAGFGTETAGANWTALESAASNRSMVQYRTSASALTNERGAMTSSTAVTSRCLIISIKDGGAAAGSDITVCASGCDFSDLQLAIAAAVCGDTIRLQANEVFEGNFDVTDNGDCRSRPIVVTTSATSGLPPNGDRLCPTGVDAIEEGWCVANIDPAILPKIQATQESATQNTPALLFAAGAMGWTFKLIEIRNNFEGSSATVRVGQNTAAAQGHRADQPDTIVFDQIFWNLREHHPYWGQKRAIEMHCKKCTLSNSYVDGPNSVGSDANAVWTVNGEGPLVVRNNWFRGTTEQILSGGDTSFIRTVATVTAATTTSASLDWSAGLTPDGDCPFVGQTLAISVSAATNRRHVQAATVTNCTATSADVTWTPAIAETPDSPGDVRWGVIVGDCQFQDTCETGALIEYNSMSRDLAWRTDSVIPTPTGLMVSAAGGGSLTAGTYTVSVSARARTQGSTIQSDDTATQQVVVGANGSITWSVDAMHADITGCGSASNCGFRVWVVHPDGTTRRTDFLTNSGSITANGTSGTPPSAGDKWQLKNLLEMKQGIGWIIRYNTLFNSWSSAAGSGIAIWIKSTNQASCVAPCTPSVNNNQPWSENTNTLIEYNVVHSAPGLFSLNGNSVENNDNFYRTKGTSLLTVRNLLGYDISTATWGTSGTDQFFLSNGCTTCTFEHITSDSTSSNGFGIEVDGSAALNNILGGGFIFRNSLIVRPSANGGIKGPGIAEGIVTLESQDGTNCGASPPCDSGDYIFEFNVWGNRAGSVSAGAYPNQGVTSPVGNLFLSYATWANEFVDQLAWQLDHHDAVEGYALDAGSAYNDAGSDGTDIGVQDIALMATEIDKARSGLLGETQPPDPPPSTHTMRLLMGVGE